MDNIIINSTIVAVMSFSVYLYRSQKLNIQNACKFVHVDVTFNFVLSRLQFRGFKDNIGKVPLHQTIKQAEDSIKEKQNAHLTLKQVGLTGVLSAYMQ